MKRGQISVEYLIVVGFILFVVVGLLAVAFLYVASVQSQLRSNQIDNYGNKIVTAAENVFFSGYPSQVTINAFLPGGVTKTIIIKDPVEDIYFLQITYESNAGESTILYSSDVPLDTTGEGAYLVLSCENGGTGFCDEGVKRIEIKAGQNNVKITEVP